MSDEVVPSYAYGPDCVPAEEDPAHGMWRWSRLLPFDGSADYPLPVGGTPLISMPDVGRALGAGHLMIKDETRGPSGSNKDRATALCVADALRRSRSVIACASTGNVATSLAIGAAAVGMHAVTFVAHDAIASQKERLMRSFGATVVKVRGSYEDAYQVCEDACRMFGWYSRNTGTNPLAFQAKKTVAFEIWEQAGRRVPDDIFVPVGDGVTAAAIAHGFDELVACGVATTSPRLIGVQASGAAPLAEAFRTGRHWSIRPVRTIADGIAVGDPVFGAQVLDAVQRTNGAFIVVTDDEIRAAIATLAAAGFLAEPAGAAALAGLAAWVREHGASDRQTVVLVTGSGLKDDRWWPDDRGRSVSVGPSVDELMSAGVAPPAETPTAASTL